MMTPHVQVMAILERIKRQDAGEIEPPAIAIGGKMGANPASEDFVEQSAAASRQQAAEAVGGDNADNAMDLPDEVRALLRSAQKLVSKFQRPTLSMQELVVCPKGLHAAHLQLHT